MAKKSTIKDFRAKLTAQRSREWLPPLPKGKGSIVYGLNSHPITASAWDYALTQNIEFIPIPLEAMPASLKKLRDTLPGPDSGLQTFPVKMGDEEISPPLDCLVLYGLKQTVPEGKAGVEHSAVRILTASDSANSAYSKDLQNRRNFDCLGADGLMLAAILWEQYSIEQHYQELIDWNKTILAAHRDFFTTPGWVNCAIEVTL